MSTSHLSELVHAAGGVTAVADRMGRSVGTVSSWISRNKVPAESALAFATAVSRSPHEIRPDLYPAGGGA